MEVSHVVDPHGGDGALKKEWKRERTREMVLRLQPASKRKIWKRRKRKSYTF